MVASKASMIGLKHINQMIVEEQANEVGYYLGHLCHAHIHAILPLAVAGINLCRHVLPRRSGTLPPQRPREYELMPLSNLTDHTLSNSTGQPARILTINPVDFSQPCHQS